ncbi:MAG TPA: alpha/beta hydrolase [Planctomycetota bacterium]|nr:alpha/beta hydrolase [Planctomycetota bacterium]
MANFVLVHGSGQNAGSWARVAERLASSGHDVEAPDLPKQPPGWGLQRYADEIARSVGPDTVIVAHSLSGIFLPLVARARPCGLLVFFAAVLPEPGRSVRQQLQADASMFNPEWIKAGSRWFAAHQVQSLAREFLYHDCDDETLPWALSTLEMLDTRTLVTEPCPLQAWPDVPSVSVIATGDRTLSPDWGRRVSRLLPRCEVIEMHAGHCPHVSQSRQTADLLERLARDMARRRSRDS